MDRELNENELEIFGLRESEKKVILSISKMGKSIAMITRHTNLPRSTVKDSLIRLEKRTLIKSALFGKERIWRSNIEKNLQTIAYNQKIKNLKKSKKNK